MAQVSCLLNSAEMGATPGACERCRQPCLPLRPPSPPHPPKQGPPDWTTSKEEVPPPLLGLFLFVWAESKGGISFHSSFLPKIWEKLKREKLKVTTVLIPRNPRPRPKPRISAAGWAASVPVRPSPPETPVTRLGWSDFPPPVCPFMAGGFSSSRL